MRDAQGKDRWDELRYFCRNAGLCWLKRDGSEGRLPAVCEYKVEAFSHGHSEKDFAAGMCAPLEKRN